MNWTIFLVVANFFFSLTTAIYFGNLLKTQRTQKISMDKEGKKELEQLQKLRKISLNVPLSEKVRPTSFDDIIGQEEGIEVLKAALCGANPQHVIIYGPAGIGKTAAARLVLDEAKKQELSPFRPDAKFIELDATTARFDERGIADFLIGSVHDPIYQGAGSFGQMGVPQPKQGAVSDAHGGILFIDEIGELHSIQMNKLLKVLEDRKVFLESVYYNEENTNIPVHIHDIFKNGLPADFRLVGATTRSPEEIPPAIRSRCLEVFFRPLETAEIVEITKGAAEKLQVTFQEESLQLIGTYATNGREAINLLQLIGGMLLNQKRNVATKADVQKIVELSQLTPKYEFHVHKQGRVGVVNGLAVYGGNIGAVLEMEVTAMKVDKTSELTVTGIVEEENIANGGKSIRRKSMVKSSVENVITALRNLELIVSDYHIHVNFPSGALLDGPSAAIAIATGVFSAISGLPVNSKIAMTGEVGIYGDVKSVGGVFAKVKAAKKAGAKKVIIPKGNFEELLEKVVGIEVLPVTHIQEVFEIVFGKKEVTFEEKLVGEN